jgi:hypothetical protein
VRRGDSRAEVAREVLLRAGALCDVECGGVCEEALGRGGREVGVTRELLSVVLRADVWRRLEGSTEGE